MRQTDSLPSMRIATSSKASMESPKPAKTEEAVFRITDKPSKAE